jgi:acyl-CoA reductase-like NAD-dependent aldehyde dehydrogenase
MKMLLKENIFVPLIIDGKDVHLSNDDHTFTPDSLHSKSHRTVQVLAQGADIASCQAAVDSCARAFETWRATSTAERRRLLLRLAQLFREKEEKARELLADEIYATPLWATINIEDTFAMIHEAAAGVTSPLLSGSIPTTSDPEAEALVFTEPLGVILGIAPWNAPMILGFRAVLPAIAAGNTAILKGSELSPRIHYFIANLFREAGFPNGVCNFLLHRDVDAAAVFETIIERHEVRKCNFTGSTPVGRMIASRAARALKPCLMELGGKNYAIVLEDADLNKAARLVIEGAFLHVSLFLRRLYPSFVLWCVHMYCTSSVPISSTR